MFMFCCWCKRVMFAVYAFVAVFILPRILLCSTIMHKYSICYVIDIYFHIKYVMGIYKMYYVTFPKCNTLERILSIWLKLNVPFLLNHETESAKTAIGLSPENFLWLLGSFCGEFVFMIMLVNGFSLAFWSSCPQPMSSI